MKICLIVEGNYPYITGGVSSWIQLLISSMPEHQFIVYSIGAEERNRGYFKYTLPPNIIKVEEIFLDSILNEKGSYGKKYKLTKDEMQNLASIISKRKVDWTELIFSLNKRKIQNIIDFFMSKDFFHVIINAYKKEHGSTPFTEYFYTIRSMLIPLLYIMNQDLVEADIYHSITTGFAGVVGSMASCLYLKPFILTEHGIYAREREEEIIKSNWIPEYFKDNWIEFFYRLARLAYYRADKVITLFEKNKEIQIDLGCPAEKIKVIPNGIDVTAYSQNEPQVKEEYINIGAIVRIVPIKDIITMIQSFYLVKKRIANARFYIIGPTDENMEYYEECKQLVEQLELKDDLIFTGNVDILDYLAKLDILVLTSISEGQPLALLEGMAAKKPFVTTDVGSCKELLYGNDDDFGQAGKIVPVMDYEKAAGAIIELCRDEKLRREMGLNGLNRISSLYTLEKFIASYRNVYGQYTHTGGYAKWRG